MFRKLIIAMLTLGLLLTFGSAVLSSDTPHKGLNPIERVNDRKGQSGRSSFSGSDCD